MITDKQRAHKVCKVIDSCNSTQLAAIGDWVVKQLKRLSYSEAMHAELICLYWAIQMDVVAREDYQEREAK